MDQPGRLERVPDRADPAVHHVGRRHDVDTGLCLDDRLAPQDLDGLVIEHVAVGVDDAVLSVAGERVQRDVGQDAEIREARLDRLHGPGHETLRVGRDPAVRRLQAGFDHREDRHHRNAEPRAAFGDAEQLIDRVAMHAGHRWDRYRCRPAGPAVMDEDRIDQVVGPQMMFLGEPAAEVGTTIAAHPGSRKGGVDLALRRRRVVHLACSTGDD